MVLAVETHITVFFFIVHMINHYNLYNRATRSGRQPVLQNSRPKMIPKKRPLGVSQDGAIRRARVGVCSAYE